MIGELFTSPLPWEITSRDPARSRKCQTIPFKQTIQHKDCRTKIIDNNYCMGGCMSSSKPNEKKVQNCSVCWYGETEKINITLDCPKRNKKIKIKKVLLVKSCVCKKLTECR